MTAAGDKPADIEGWLAQLGRPSADRDYKPGHERLLELLALLEPLPLKRPRLRVRVAGTNGKGSTAFMVAAALQAAGLKTGLYTSPHILAFNERIRIDGEPVSTETIMAGLARLMPAALAAGASYFETATALALLCFSEAEVDAEVLEAGVGARLDATTAVPADAAIITPIGLDHQAWLGNSLAQIAEEKAHALDGCRIGLSALQPATVIDILRRHCPALIVVDDAFPPLAHMRGHHQQRNAALAFAAVQQLEREFAFGLEAEQARRAIADVAVPGRLQPVRLGSAEIWLDAAHNLHAVEALLPTLPELAGPFDAIIVFTREDRSLADALPLLAPYARRIVTDADYPNVAQALAAALKLRPDGKFLLLGSFTTVAAGLEWIQQA